VEAARVLSTGLAKLQHSSEEEIAAGNIKTYWNNMAKERLPVLVGMKFCDVLLFCLDVDGDGQIPSDDLMSSSDFGTWICDN
jgi:hypothetical protein